MKIELEEDRITFNKGKIEAVTPKELLIRDKKDIEEYIIKAIMFYKDNNKHINIQL